MRITTTLDSELARQAQAKAEALQESLSAFVSEAVRMRLEHLEQDAAYRDLEALVGPGFAKETYKQSLRNMRDT